jgi:hypothetical protein
MDVAVWQVLLLLCVLFVVTGVAATVVALVLWSRNRGR